MKIYTAGSLDDIVVGAATCNDRVLVLLRRVAVTAGLLFGLGLVALLTANQASADDLRHGGEGQSVEGQSETDSGVLSGLVDTVDPVLEPVNEVVGSGAEALGPVVRPLAETVEPVTAPVLEPVVEPAVATVSPVLDVVRPVTAPLLAPVLDAAEPVVTPVTDVTGVDDGVSAVGGQERGGQVPVQRAESAAPSAELPAGAPALPVESVAVSEDVRGGPAPATEMARHSFVHAGPRVAAGLPGNAPDAPINAALGSTGSMGGSAGPQSADATVPASADVAGGGNHTGRGPPGTVTGSAWSGYDNRDHPR